MSLIMDALRWFWGEYKDKRIVCAVSKEVWERFAAKIGLGRSTRMSLKEAEARTLILALSHYWGEKNAKFESYESALMSTLIREVDQVIHKLWP